MRANKGPDSDIGQLCEPLPSGLTMVEVGSFAGESMLIFANSGKFNNIYCVDAWDASIYDPWCKQFNPKDVEESFDARWKNVQKLLPITIYKYKGLSVDASESFADNMFDLIYIDALHDHASVVTDLKAWLPKLKPGGIISGHDYAHGVRSAVHEVIGEPDNVYCCITWAKTIYKS